MKSFTTILIVFTCFASCKNADIKNENVSVKAQKDTANYTTIQWLDSVKNIGDIQAGEKAKIEFRFKNTGDKPLFISSAEPGCGCTIADYPKEAIASGQQGVLKAEYTASKGGSGEFRKNIAVTTNTKGKEKNYIFFQGKILTPADFKDEQKAQRPDSLKTKSNLH